jgi:DNA-binding transcriptional regulator YiaG
VTPADFRSALADLGYTQVGFARIARVDPRTVRKWASGESAVPGPVVALLELLAAHPEAARPKVRRGSGGSGARGGAAGRGGGGVS